MKFCDTKENKPDTICVEFCQKRDCELERIRCAASGFVDCCEGRDKMSFYGVLAGVIITGVGATLEGISVAITGIQSTKTTDSSAKSTLLAACFTILIGAILFIVTLVLFFLYQRKKKYGNAKALGITTIIIGAISILLLATGAIIAGVFSNRYKESDPVAYNALRTAAVLVGIGILLMLIGYGILILLVGRRTGGR